jgi:hypothetical protein
VEPSVTPDAPDGFDREAYAQAIWFSPGGLVSIDPVDVVSEWPAETYEIFPSQMGLAQLVGSGAIEIRGDGSFYIARPIARFPAGLAGAHSVTFILGRGVPMPAGDPAHSCVISEETGLPLVAAGHCSSL